jgi:hypothetical protein
MHLAVFAMGFLSSSFFSLFAQQPSHTLTTFDPTTIQRAALEQHISLSTKKKENFFFVFLFI